MARGKKKSSSFKGSAGQGSTQARSSVAETLTVSSPTLSGAQVRNSISLQQPASDATGSDKENQTVIQPVVSSSQTAADKSVASSSSTASNGPAKPTATIKAASKPSAAEEAADKSATAQPTSSSAASSKGTTGAATKAATPTAVYASSNKDLAATTVSKDSAELAQLTFTAHGSAPTPARRPSSVRKQMLQAGNNSTPAAAAPAAASKRAASINAVTELPAKRAAFGNTTTPAAAPEVPIAKKLALTTANTACISGDSSSMDTSHPEPPFAQACKQRSHGRSRFLISFPVGVHKSWGQFIDGLLMTGYIIPTYYAAGAMAGIMGALKAKLLPGWAHRGKC